MSELPKKDTSLLLRCPSCGMTADIDSSKFGHTAECENCFHQFEITEELCLQKMINHGDDSKMSPLGNFRKIQESSLSHPINVPAYKSVTLANPNTPTPDLHTFSLSRGLLTLLGVSVIVGMLLLLIFGASNNGLLRGVTTDKRIIMAVFAALLGGGLLIYANPRSLIWMISVAVVSLITLPIVPLWLSEESALKDESVAENYLSENSPPIEQNIKDETVDLSAAIGISPLRDEAARLKEANSAGKALGLWIRGMASGNRYLVRDYMMRVSHSGIESHIYPRGLDDYLMVISDTRLTLDELAKEAAVLGVIANVYPDLEVVEVQIDQNIFSSVPMESLTNPNDLIFYKLNLDELNNIDMLRIEGAVKRLCEAEPKVMRYEINQRLVELLSYEWINFKSTICTALMKWADAPGPAGEAALKEAHLLLSKKHQVPRELVELCIKEKTEGVISLLNALWIHDPSEWELVYASIGSAAEESVLKSFQDSNADLINSALRLLGFIGTDKSLMVLKSKDQTSLKNEQVILLNNSIESIEKRVNAK